MSRRIVSVGECMVELAPAGGGLYRRGFAGDSFNTAWYLRRQLGADATVAYATAVGTDAISDEMVAFLAAEGIATDAVQRIGGRTVGLYMIALADGERTFSYWRAQSAARRLAGDPAALAAAFAGADVVIATGITMAIVDASDRANVLAALANARLDGASVVFDPNLRPLLWPDADTMRREVERAAAVADIVLPSFDDEHAHFGDADPAATIARYRALGAATVVVKNGGGEVRAWSRTEGDAMHAPEPVAIVDSTAAGDSFNAGFLAARLDGWPLAEAIVRGARLAGIVVGAPGALVRDGTAA